MKKVADILRANILIFFGALLFLLFVNYLAGAGTVLAAGIIATVISLYYIAIGILGIFIGNKLNKKVFDVISVCLFVFFIFIGNIFSIVDVAEAVADGTRVGPTAWIVAIFGMLASLALLVFYPIAKFANKSGLKNLTYLFAGLFTLSLLTNILFDFQGFAINLGQIPFMYVAVYALFAIYLFGSLDNGDTPAKEEPKAIEQKEEEKPEEPAPQEEAPAEEPKSEE
ncbi:MAG: hypothetical protein J6I84_01260 [Bacilli bacterium]|nr:hypothetical protein [Bacilli bacterium]